jgi:flavin reductase (DIM6/NTAB) family NADH-FMN oxidoreductase RutF
VTGLDLCFVLQLLALALAKAFTAQFAKQTPKEDEFDAFEDEL